MKQLNVIKWVLLALSFVVFVVAASTITGIDSPTLDLYMGWTYALVAATLIATLGFPLVKAIKDKKKLVHLLILIAAVVVILGGSYALAPGGEVSFKSGVSLAESKFSDAALYVAYLFVAAAVVSLVWTGVRNSIKK